MCPLIVGWDRQSLLPALEKLPSVTTQQNISTRLSSNRIAFPNSQGLHLNNTRYALQYRNRMKPRIFSRCATGCPLILHVPLEHGVGQNRKNFRPFRRRNGQISQIRTTTIRIAPITRSHKIYTSYKINQYILTADGGSISPDTTHEFLSRRRSLREFALLLFKDSTAIKWGHNT